LNQLLEMKGKFTAHLGVHLFLAEHGAEAPAEDS
jgi:hypothetical protein